MHCDTRCIDTLKIVSIPVSLFCILRYGDASMHHPISTVACFGRQWSGKVAEFIVDNEAVVEVLKATYSKDFHLMHLVKLLVFFASTYDFCFKATHIWGNLNGADDALSRNQLSLFFQQVPQADLQPVHIRSPLVSLMS